MTTLCERLRAHVRAYEATKNGDSSACRSMRESADRIEALEAALREIRALPNQDHITDGGIGFAFAVSIAGKALGQAPAEAREAAGGRVE